MELIGLIAMAVFGLLLLFFIRHHNQYCNITAQKNLEKFEQQVVMDAEELLNAMPEAETIE